MSDADASGLDRIHRLTGEHLVGVGVGDGDHRVGDEQADATQQRADDHGHQARQEQHDDVGDVLVDERETRLDRLPGLVFLVQDEVREELDEEGHDDRADVAGDHTQQRQQTGDDRGDDDRAEQAGLEELAEFDLALGGAEAGTHDLRLHDHAQDGQRDGQDQGADRESAIGRRCSPTRPGR